MIQRGSRRCSGAAATSDVVSDIGEPGDMVTASFGDVESKPRYLPGTSRGVEHQVRQPIAAVERSAARIDMLNSRHRNAHPGLPPDAVAQLDLALADHVAPTPPLAF